MKLHFFTTSHWRPSPRILNEAEESDLRLPTYGITRGNYPPRHYLTPRADWRHRGLGGWSDSS